MRRTPFYCLSEDTYLTIKKYHREKVITDETYRALEDCSNIKELENAVRASFSLTTNWGEKAHLWLYNKIFMWHVDRHKRYWPDEFQSHFLWTLLIQKNGVHTREECQKKSYTDTQIQNQILVLEETGLIMCIRTRKNVSTKTYFVLSPKIAHQLKNE